MTNNKPEVKAWVISAYVPYSGFQRHVCMSEDDARQSRAFLERLKGEVEENLLISISDYETLQAERDKLRKELLLWSPIHMEVERRAEKMHCLQDRCDFEVTVFYEDYAAIQGDHT